MTPARRCAALLVSLLAVLGLGAGTAAAEQQNPYAADRAVIVGVPGLRWDDVTARATPQLAALAAHASIGALSVRAARAVTCVLDGWATLGAGNRAHVPVADGPPTADGCLPQERAARDLGDPAAALATTARDPGTRAFGSRPGALGAAVGCADVSGPAAALAAAAPEVRPAPMGALPPNPTAVAGLLLTGCPLKLISLDQLATADPGGRRAALAAVDDQVGRLRAAIADLPGRTLLLVEGLAETGTGPAQLHVAIAAGPGFPAGRWLTSASTGRAPYVQLIDAAPTALQALGRPVPASMNGQPMRADGARPAGDAAVAALVRDGAAAAVHYRSTGIFFWTLVGLVAAVVAAGMALLRRRPPLGIRALRAAALAVAAVPAATYLAGLLPWERSGAPRWALLGALLAADAVIAVAAGLGAGVGAWRRARFGPPLAVLLVTAATLVGDVVTGSHLELNGLLGYDAIVAGRFVGYGNLSFALLATSGLLLATALAGWAARRGAGRWGLAAIVLACGAALVAVDGAPGLGRDFGGVLSAVPGVLLLALLLSRARVTVFRVVAILGAAVVTVGTVAVLDWLRPPAQRTHLGRFVGQLGDGGAWTVVSRKAQSNVSILLHSPLTWMLPVMLVAAVWLLRGEGPLRGRTGPDGGALRCGLVAVALTLAISAAVNDSGVALPATAAALLVPLLVWLAAAPSGAGPGHAATAGGGPASDPGGAGDRVTVGSRGSTVWNA